jgi:predicted small secreted protein
VSSRLLGARNKTVELAVGHATFPQGGTFEMRRSHFALAAAVVLAFGLAGCNKDRAVTADTGSATATVSTTAPPAAVPDAQLQEQAQQAATAASTPVDGSGPVATTTAVAPTAPAKK